MMIELEFASDVVDQVIERVGTDLIVATPLGAGKPNHVLNAFYRRARQDPALSLTILTALTLQKPTGNSDLERRFLGPFAERIFEDYPDLDYEIDRVAGKLPANVRVLEFYFPPGKFVGNSAAQRNYISSNYTHAARDILARGVNVLASQVCEMEIDGRRRLSLSCNPDVAIDVMYDLIQQEDAGQKVAFVAQVNQELPFMFGDAEIDPESFHFIVNNRNEDYKVFGPPKMSVSAADHMIGLYVSSLIRDNGELQVGIGALGDAVVSGLLLRQRDNELYVSIMEALEADRRFGATINDVGGTEPFDEGLFSASEMMIDGFLNLMDSGIIKRKVYDDIHIQRLLNMDVITETVTGETLDHLIRVGAVSSVLTEPDVRYLRYFGIFSQDVKWQEGTIVLKDGTQLSPDVKDGSNLADIKDKCLGTTLRRGAIMHAGFFLGPQAFYQKLKDMPEDQRNLIRMRSVQRINQVFGHEDIDRLHRRNGRFVNTAMMVTLSGAAVSDGLDNGTVVSGVGGQYNFVAMAHELPGGRSIINLRSTRMHMGKLVSNIVFNYGHITIPRHLRDLVVTEYGIANLRSKCDEEIIQELLNIADSRFQESLRLQAVGAGKLSPDYSIPECHKGNLPSSYQQILDKHADVPELGPFPLGCDFTQEELTIGKALKWLKAQTANKPGLLKLLPRALAAKPAEKDRLLLQRMNLDIPSSMKERLYQGMLVVALRETN